MSVRWTYLFIGASFCVLAVDKMLVPRVWFPGVD